MCLVYKLCASIVPGHFESTCTYGPVALHTMVKVVLRILVLQSFIGVHKHADCTQTQSHVCTIQS